VVQRSKELGDFLNTLYVNSLIKKKFQRHVQVPTFDLQQNSAIKYYVVHILKECATSN
jgi:hypothetical protein